MENLTPICFNINVTEKPPGLLGLNVTKVGRGSTIIEENRTRVVYNWLQHFSRESLTKEFEGGGFILEYFYSDVCGTPFSEDAPDMAIVLKKPLACRNSS